MRSHTLCRIALLLIQFKHTFRGTVVRFAGHQRGLPVCPRVRASGGAPLARSKKSIYVFRPI